MTTVIQADIRHRVCHVRRVSLEKKMLLGKITNDEIEETKTVLRRPFKKKKNYSDLSVGFRRLFGSVYHKFDKHF